MWQFIRKYTIAEVLRLHPLDITNQILGSHINYSTPQELDGCSLLLVKAVRPTISVITYQNDYSTKTKIYFNFNNNNIYYFHFSVSDISLYDYYRQKPDGTYSLRDGYAVVSLTGAWALPGQINDIRHYKMLAQFF